MTDYSKLKSLAEAASQGQWVAGEDSIDQYVNGERVDLIVWTGSFGDHGSFKSDEDKEYIAAASPVVIRQLLRELDFAEYWLPVEQRIKHELLSELKEIRQEVEGRFISDRIELDIQKLKADIQLLRKDAERYRWIKAPEHASEAERLAWTAGDSEDFDKQIDDAIAREKAK